MAEGSVEGENLIVKNISKKCKTKNKVVNVLHDVNFNIQKDEIISIIGSSSCGRSTLLRIIAGIDIDYDVRRISGFWCETFTKLKMPYLSPEDQAMTPIILFINSTSERTH
ncbi:MAG: ABC-type nitrate/sulfonate/bicarbonate transport system, ATPase component [Firmicutes bacterium]|nr:ABC-type nitrate/sulfonate/bicarbonate transport system, ATPase component [Bacillota bacterium]